MKQIKKFWNTFQSVHINLFISDSTANANLGAECINALKVKLRSIHKELDMVITFSDNESGSARVYFLTKGKVKLRDLVVDIVAQAPALEMWQYKIGIPPYPDSIQNLWKNYVFLDQDTHIYQVYMGIDKIYKSSSKLHLIIYVETNGRFTRPVLRSAVKNILIWYLGDTNYYQHIGRFKIVRRKFRSINFITIPELKNLIEYKSNN